MASSWRIEVSKNGASPDARREAVIDADNWMGALRAGRQALGMGTDPLPGSELTCEFREDGTVQVSHSKESTVYVVGPAATKSFNKPTPRGPQIPADAVPPNKTSPGYVKAADVPRPRVGGSVAPARPASTSTSGVVPSPSAIGRGAPSSAPPRRESVPPASAIQPAVDAPPEGLTRFGIRLQDPTADNKLLVHEATYAVAEGTSIDDAEELLRLELERVQNELSSRPQGKLVALAVFDHTWAGKPKRGPLVTLTWRDWREGEPEVKRGKARRSSRPPPASDGAAASRPPSSVVPPPPAAGKSSPPAASASVPAPPASTRPAAPASPDAPVIPAPPTPAVAAKPGPVVIGAADPPHASPPAAFVASAPIATPAVAAPAASVTAPAASMTAPAASMTAAPAPASPMIATPVAATPVTATPVAATLATATPVTAAPVNAQATAAASASEASPSAAPKVSDWGPPPASEPIAPSAAVVTETPIAAAPAATPVTPASASPRTSSASLDTAAPAPTVAVSPSPDAPAAATTISSPPVAMAPPASEPVPPAPAPALEVVETPPIPLVSPVAAAAPVPVLAPEPAPAAALATPLPPPPAAPAPAAATAPSNERPSRRAPGPQRARKSTGEAAEDRLADVFERVQDLFFLQTALEGCEFVMRLCREMIPCEAGSALLYDINADELRFVFVDGPVAEQLKGQAVSPRSGVIGFSTSVGYAVLVADVGAEPRFDRSVDRRTGFQSRSLLTSRVQLEGQLLGALQLVNSTGSRGFTAEDGHLLEYIAEQFADYLVQARLRSASAEQKLRKR